MLQWATQRPRCPTVTSLSGVPSGATNKRVESPGMSPGLSLLLGEQRMLQWGLSALLHVVEESFCVIGNFVAILHSRTSTLGKRVFSFKAGGVGPDDITLERSRLAGWSRRPV